MMEAAFGPHWGERWDTNGIKSTIVVSSVSEWLAQASKSRGGSFGSKRETKEHCLMAKLKLSLIITCVMCCLTTY